MKKTNKYLLLLSFLLGLYSTTQSNQCSNLIILLDPKSEEKPDTIKALGATLICALQEKVAPIITTSNILENFCFWKTEHEELLKAVKGEFYRTKKELTAQQKAQELVANQAKPNFSLPNPQNLISSAPTLSLTDATDGWDCYAHKEANLILLLPKKYMTQRVEKLITNIRDQIKACGFDSDHFNKIDNKSHDSILTHLQTKRIENPINIVNGLEKIFVANSGTWNIFLSGHGGPAKKRKTIQTELEALQAGLVKNEEDLDFIEKNFDFIIKSGLEHLKPSTEHLIVLQKQEIKNLSTLLKSKENLSDDTIISTTATVAGLDFNDFSRLMKLFNDSIKTSFLHYATCFAGGYNQPFVNEILSKLKVNFIVSSQGINEQVVTTSFPRLKEDPNAPGLVLAHMKFTLFFSMLEEFFGTPSSFGSNIMVKQSTSRKDPIAAIIKNIIPTDHMLISNQPFVRIPSIGIFTALEVDQKVKILTNSVSKAHELEGRTLDYSGSDIRNILVYPTDIKVPLKIGHFVGLVSPTPKEVLSKNQIVHVLEELIVPNDYSLNNIIINFIVHNISHNKIIFVIKKLKCQNYEQSGIEKENNDTISIENMMIEITGHILSGEKVNADIKVTLETNSKIYAFSKLIEKISQSTAYEQLTNQNFSASNITPDMHHQTISNLSIDAYQTTSTQKPGALKKILLLQQLDGLEKAIKPQQLVKEKQWLEQNKKPTKSFINNLNRHTGSLLKLKQQIHLLSAQEMSDQERSSALERISSIERKIAEALPK